MLNVKYTLQSLSHLVQSGSGLVEQPFKVPHVPELRQRLRLVLLRLAPQLAAGGVVAGALRLLRRLAQRHGAGVLQDLAHAPQVSRLVVGRRGAAQRELGVEGQAVRQLVHRELQFAGKFLASVGLFPRSLYSKFDGKCLPPQFVCFPFVKREGK